MGDTKNILPPSTQVITTTVGHERLKGALQEVFEEVMLNTAEGRYLSQMGTDLSADRPPIFFSDDDLYRAVVRAVAFNKRHTLDGVRRFVELILKPKVSQVTVLNRDNKRRIVKGDILTITAPAGLAGNYTVSEVGVHALTFSSGTFPAAHIPNLSGEIKYTVGKGPVPLVSPISGFSASLTVLADGRERLTDTNQQFINLQRFDLFTKLNKNFPQYCEVWFSKNSPFEELKTVSFYDRDVSGLAKLRSADHSLKYTHKKYVPIKGSRLVAAVEAGATELELESLTDFPANGAGEQLINPVAGNAESITIREGTNAGTYTITSVTKNSLTLSAALTVTGPAAKNRYKITPNTTSLGIGLGGKGTIFSRGGIVSSAGGASVFYDPTVDFTEIINVERFAVTINRGEINEETIEVSSINDAGTKLVLVKKDKFSKSSESALIFPHAVHETVEIAGLSYETTCGYIKHGVATGGSDTTLNDSSDPFTGAVIGSDVEIYNAEGVMFLRSITAADNDKITWEDALPADISANTTVYKIRKQYTASDTDDTALYVTDSSGFPKEEFSVVVDRGKPTEEVLFIASNTRTTHVSTVLMADAAKGATSLTVASAAGLSNGDRIVLEYDVVDDLVKPPKAKSEVVAISNISGTTLTVSALTMAHGKASSVDKYSTLGVADKLTIYTTGSENNNALVSQSHKFGAAVEAAQVYVKSCDWDIIETRATGEYTLHVDKTCVPEITVQDSFYLHEKVDNLVASENIVTFPGIFPDNAALSAGDSVLYSVWDDFTSKIENLSVGQPVIGEVLKPIIIDEGVIVDGSSVEENKFISTQRYFTRLVTSSDKTDDPADGNKYLEVDSAKAFFELNKLVDANDIYLHLNRGGDSEYIQLDNVDVDASPHRLYYTGALTKTHYKQSTIEVSLGSPNPGVGKVALNLPHGCLFAHAANAKVKLLYIDDVTVAGNSVQRFKHKDPFNENNWTLQVNGTIGGSPANDPSEIYFASSGKDQKEIWPGSYLIGSYNPETKEGINQITSTKTAFHPAVDLLNPDALIQISGPRNIVENEDLVISDVLKQKLVAGALVVRLKDSSKFPQTGTVIVARDGIGGLSNASIVLELKYTHNDTAINQLTLSNPVPAPLPDGLGAYMTGTKVELKSSVDKGLPLGTKSLYIDDGRFFPKSGQNPFYIVINKGSLDKEEVLQCVGGHMSPTEKYPHRYRLLIDQTEDVTENHPMGSPVHLQVRKLRLSSVFGLGSSGGLYLDYGFSNGASLGTEIVEHVGTFDHLGGTGIDQNFDPETYNLSKRWYYIENPLFNFELLPELTGSFIKYPNTDAGKLYEITSAMYEPDAGELRIKAESPDGALLINNADGLSYKLYVPKNVDGVGGVYSDIGAPLGTPGTTHPKRGLNGIVQEYIEYNNVTGNVVTLTFPMTFENDYPNGTPVYVASNKYKSSGDGTDYPPYLTGNYLEILFNPELTNLPKLIKAAGIEVKVEVD